MDAHVLTRRDYVVGDVDTPLSILMATVLVVLLVACANVASLLLMRASAQRHEYAVRAALGSGWRRLAALMLGESLLLAVIGGGVGLWLTFLSLDPLLDLVPGALPRRDEIGINKVVAAFALGSSLLAACLAGLLPAIRVGRAAPAGALRNEGYRAGTPGRATRVQSALVIATVTLLTLTDRRYTFPP